jgi:recombination protein RecT
MAPTTQQNGQIVKRKDDEQPPLVRRLVSASVQQALKDALPKHIPNDRFSRIALTALRANSDLMNSDETSFLACLLQSAQLGLEPNTPLQHCFLVPRRDNRNGGYQTTLQIGYQGMLDLAQRAGRVSIAVGLVYEGDAFEYVAGDSERFTHTPNLTAPYRGQEKVLFAYAIATYPDGNKIRRIVPRWELDKAYNMRATKKPDGIWEKHPEEMMKKTAIRRLFKLIPKSAEMAALSVVSSLEDATETGRANHALVSPEVVSMLKAEGLQLPGDQVVEGDVTYDASTGEVSAAEEPQG